MAKLPVSSKVSTITSARPSIVESRFIYNYFLPDEAKNDQVDTSGGFVLSTENASNFENSKNFSTTVSRVISLTIQPGQILGTTPSNEIAALLEGQNLNDFLMKDIDLNYPNIMGIRIGDGEIIGRITKLSNHLHAIKTEATNDSVNNIMGTMSEEFSDEISLSVIQSCLTSVAPIFPTHGDGSESLGDSNKSQPTVNFVPPLPSQDKFIKSAGYTIDLKIATDLFDKCMSQSANFSSTPLTQFILTNFSNLKRWSKNAPFVDEHWGNEHSLIPLAFEKVDQHESPEYYNAGIILQKYEINAEGLQHIEDTLYPVDSDMSTFNIYDPNIKFGTTYAYGLRELYLIKATVNTDLPDLGSGIFRTNFLIEGSPSALKFISCFEKIAPRPPEALFVRRGQNAKGIMLQWQFPTNPQRDIKKFQVFRRRNIGEPFFLIKQIDFNNADPALADVETIDDVLIERVNFPKTTFEDTTFKRYDKCIYAVCSIDAHGYTSVLSAQIEVSINLSTNIPTIRTISPAGAPKQYPNMYVSTDPMQDNASIRLTEDVIRVSGYDSVEVFFEPEAKKIQKGSQLVDVYQLALSSDIETNPKFVLQFLNLDNGKGQNIDILIRDVRIEKD